MRAAHLPPVQSKSQSVPSRFFATLLGSLTVASLCSTFPALAADDPVLLASARIELPWYQRPSMGSEAFTLSLSQPLFGARAKAMKGEAIVVENKPKQDAALETHLEKRPEALREFLTTRRNLSEYGQSRMWATFSAGYGTLICEEPEVIFRSYDGWEEPACGYFKVSFSF